MPIRNCDVDLTRLFGMPVEETSGNRAFLIIVIDVSDVIVVYRPFKAATDLRLIKVSIVCSAGKDDLYVKVIWNKWGYGGRCQSPLHYAIGKCLLDGGTGGVGSIKDDRFNGSAAINDITDQIEYRAFISRKDR